MRIAIVLLIAAVFLLGCQGSRSEPLVHDTPQVGFGILLPSPAELDALVLDSEQHQATKTTSRIARINGDSFYDSLPHPGAEADPVMPWSMMLGDTQNVSFCFFRFSGGVIGEGQFVTGLLPQIEWVGPTPTEPGEGVWIGFADYHTNNWRWYGPFVDANEWTDTTADNLEGRGQSGHFAVVNYSNSDIKFNALNYQFTHFNQVLGDEWIYFSHNDQVNPTFGNSISKVKADGSETVDLLAGDADVSYSHPRVAHIDGGDPMLVYLETSATEYKIQQRAIDMLTPPDTMISSPDALEPGGWNPEGTINFWTQESPSGDRELYASNSEVPESGMLSGGRDFTDVVYDTTWYGSPKYRVMASHYFALPAAHRSLVYLREMGPLPISGTPSLMLEVDLTATTIHPAPVSWLNGGGQKTHGFFYASKDPVDISFNIYLHLGLPGDPGGGPIDILVDPTLNFTSPIPATDATQLAFVAIELGHTSGTLHVMDLLTGSFNTAIPLADHVMGQVYWYDPTP